MNPSDDITSDDIKLELELVCESLARIYTKSTLGTDSKEAIRIALIQARIAAKYL